MTFPTPSSLWGLSLLFVSRGRWKGYFMESEWAFFFSWVTLTIWPQASKPFTLLLLWTVSFSYSFAHCSSHLGVAYISRKRSVILSVTQLVPYDFVYGAFDYVDFHLICTCLNLLVFHEASLVNKVFLILGWLQTPSVLSGAPSLPHPPPSVFPFKYLTRPESILV